MKHDSAAPRTATPAHSLAAASRRTATLFAFAVTVALTLTAVASSAPSASCAFCGKNLIKNPGAEAGRGQNATGEIGNVPGWTSTAGQFGAAAYTGFGVGWFTTKSKGPKNRGRNYFFGGTTPAATSAHASVGSQKINLPAAAKGPQGHPQRLARKLRKRHHSGAGRIHGRFGQGPVRDQDRSGHDDRR